eukprot:TRINITY_DN17091_c0_g1_i1.p1 TRINITY_DN17091_c0_g1~~TRINITY_DN17091_c0_g1_i1.p1  ORF type:complete len:349 (+),score=100.39 TRINITY_DN17091_c0_g1_i1:647-1693(+)
MVEEPILDIKDGRHVTIEQTQAETSFVANDCKMGEGESWIISGANMGGKSTFLRQNALIAILGQTGSFVPASKATIGIVDAVFSRVGASDDISRNRSTFMVEMIETATILSSATERSLLVMDEIGRGTSTLDGLAIARAVLEYIHDHKKSRCLFATHFHRLSTDTRYLSRVKCYHMTVLFDSERRISFLHHVAAGDCNASYGVEVFQLVPGVPESVIQRAYDIREGLLSEEKEILGEQTEEEKKERRDYLLRVEREEERRRIRAQEREEEEKERIKAREREEEIRKVEAEREERIKAQEIEARKETIGSQKTEEIMKMLSSLDILSITPLKAMNILYELQQKSRDEKN